jgi:hypothetical protein
MLKYIKAFITGMGWIFCGAGVVSGLTFAIWLLVKKVPTLVGWGAAGTVVGALTIIIVLISSITFSGWCLNENNEDAKFVGWALGSGNPQYLQAYKEWISKENK